MKLEGAFTIAADRARVWQDIRDPSVMAACIPGCELAEPLGEDSYRAIVGIKIGPISARFNLVVEITEEIALELVRTKARGEEGTRASVVSSDNLLTLSEPSPGVTEVNWSADVQLSGRLGKYGLGLMRKKAESLSAQFVSAFAARLEAATGEAGA